MNKDQEDIKQRLASGEVIDVVGSGRHARAHFRSSGAFVYLGDVGNLVSTGWAIQADDGTIVAYTPERLKADREARLAKQTERRALLKEHRLGRWAGWIAAARTTAEQKMVAERIANQAMSLCGIDDDAVTLEGDPPKVR